MSNTETIKKKDFIELKFTGYANNEIFDTNIESDLKTLNQKLAPKKTIVAVGEEMVVSGLDKALEEKEIGKEYEINLSRKEAFGDRKRDLIKTIPLKIFTEKKIYPAPGMVLNLDNMMAKIIAVSGARVVTDFNNPLAGKEIKYKFTAIRKVEDEKEKVEALFDLFLRFIPEYEIKDKIVIKGPKGFDIFVKSFNDKFKELIGKELQFEEIKQEPKDKHAHNHEEHSHEHNKEHNHEGHSHEGHNHNHEETHTHDEEHSHEHNSEHLHKHETQEINN